MQVIPLLSDEDLLKLGVESLGERVVLKDICKNLQSKLHAKFKCMHA